MQSIKQLSAGERQELLDMLHAQYGIENDVFSPLVFLRDDKHVWVASTSCTTTLDSLDSFTSSGLLFGRITPKGFALSIHAIHVFARYATKMVLEIKLEDVIRFLDGESVRCVRGSGGEGQFLVKAGEWFLDSGFTQKDGLVARLKLKDSGK